MSSGPDTVHDEEVSDDVDSAVLSLSLSLFRAGLDLGCGLGVVGSWGSFKSFFGTDEGWFELLSWVEVVDAITQESPNTEPSGMRGCSDMAL